MRPARLVADRRPSDPRRRCGTPSLGAVLAAALLAAGFASPRPGLAQAPAPEPAPALDRVAFAPGLAGWTTWGPEQGYGLRAQNLGAVPSRILLWAQAPGAGSSAAGCAACRGFTAACSPPLAPGQAFAFSPGGAAMVYSLSLRPADEAGPAWSALARSRGLPPQTPLADLVCEALATETGPRATPAAAPSRSSAAPLDCELQRAFHAAYLGGEALPSGSPLADAPLALLRGEPLAAAAAFEMPTVNAQDQVDGAAPALDREAALSLGDTGGDAPRADPYVYLLPGVFLATPEYQHGLLWLQSAAADCAAVTVEAFRSSRGKLPGELRLDLAGGALARLWPSQTWPDGVAATLKVSSDRPLAVMASQLGYRTSASFNASLDRPGPAAWALPLAYQEPAPLPPPFLPAAGVGHGPVGHHAARLLAPGPSAPSVPSVLSAPPPPPPSADPHPAAPARPSAPTPELRRTQVAAFNNGGQWDDLRVDTQAQGQDPRGVPLPMAPQMQLLFELGFGLGRVGGEGWARLTDAAMPFAAAFYAYRLSAGEEAATETWAAPAWRYRPDLPPAAAPRAIAFPDVGAPTGAPAGAAAADAPAARLALQNLRESPARVVVDSYDGRCGFNGSREVLLPPLEARLLPVAELPGAPWRPISLVLRVETGEAAALLELARDRAYPIGAFPPDLADALLGSPLPAAPPPPALREALLEATPALLDLPRPTTAVRQRIALRDGLAAGRCLSYRAESSAPWLRPEAPQGELPADLSLLIDPAALPAGPQEAVLRITVPEGNVLGSPATVRVRVAGGAGMGKVWLPRLLGGAAAR